jgi:hypothetical protein
MTGRKETIDENDDRLDDRFKDRRDSGFSIEELEWYISYPPYTLYTMADCYLQLERLIYISSIFILNSQLIYSVTCQG